MMKKKPGYMAAVRAAQELRIELLMTWREQVAAVAVGASCFEVPQ